MKTLVSSPFTITVYLRAIIPNLISTQHRYLPRNSKTSSSSCTQYSSHRSSQSQTARCTGATRRTTPAATTTTRSRRACGPRAPSAAGTAALRCRYRPARTRRPTCSPAAARRWSSASRCSASSETTACRPCRRGPCRRLRRRRRGRRRPRRA
ncbi:hypothetical protein GGR56DRAFT_654649 [Xylariaceae sp. FL0804]|nr:hypothetical protein GGR56DRAFT_654649 [Xylariaceae sp. FL0804]